MCSPDSSAPLTNAQIQGKKEDERRGLMDHFKTVYAIIAGLAITDAAESGLPKHYKDIGQPQFWMFCTLFITIIPMFQGADRSLVMRHRSGEAKTHGQRLNYVWDVFMLLVTALLFVGMAKAIDRGSSSPHFYIWMSITMTFDVGVLIFDYIKMRFWFKLFIPFGLTKAYAAWIVGNFSLAVICCLAAKSGVCEDWTFLVSLAVCIIALVRSISDYIFGGDFLFP